MGRMIIPFETLSAHALRGVIEDFVTREGTEYGEQEVSLERKVQDVMGQLRRGEAAIVFDADQESTNIVPTRDLDDESSG